MRVIIPVFILVIALSGCINPGPTEVNVTNNITELELILLDQEGTILQDACSERNLTDKVIILESKYCSACRIAVPILKEIEEELQTEFIFLDLSQACNLERMKELGVAPKYTPTILIGCDVYIGAYPKENFKQWIEAFIQSRGG